MFPTTVSADMNLPIITGNIQPENDSSMEVPILVSTSNIPVGTSLYISICIRIRIGGVTISIYYSKYALALNKPIVFNPVLPVGSEILDIKPTYTMAYAIN